MSARWKREFRAWAAEERLEAYYMPKKPADWEVAKRASRFAHGIVSDPAFRGRIIAATEEAILNNFGSNPVRGGIAEWLP